MVIDLKLTDIFNSPLKKNLIKNHFNNYNFISFFGDFYLTTDLYLPICSNSFLTSTDLFGFYEKIKYEHLFTYEFREEINAKRNQIEIVKNCFILGSTNNYYHDIIDCFSRIFSYDKNFLLHQAIDKIAVNETNTVKILKEILCILNIKIPIIVLKKNKIYKFENSNITANKQFKRTINLYRKFFLPKKIQPILNTFISRKDSLTRTIENEKKIVNLLENFSFKVNTLSNKTLEQQIKTFSSSKLIVAMHGAALTNLLFAHSGSTIIEITGDFKTKDGDWVSEKNSKIYNLYTRSMYNLMASECKINHYFYFAQMLEVNNHSDNKEVKFNFQKFTYTNLLVDIKTFRKFLISIQRNNIL